MATKPYAGKSLERLIEMVNQDNPDKVIVLGKDFSVGPPLDYSATPDRNTKVLFTPLPNTRWKGPQDVIYTRLSIDVLNRLPVGFIQNTPVNRVPFSIHAILPQINAALGLNLEIEEVVNQTFTEKEEYYPLIIKGDVSYAWKGSSYLFKVEFGDIDLSIAISEPILDGLVYLQP